MVATRGPRAGDGDAAPQRELHWIQLNSWKGADLSVMHIGKAEGKAV
eukprot:COSAG02_NODE_45400_length_357_cov_1.073643_1_plen_46_part_10